MRRAIAIAVDNVRLKRGGPFGALIAAGGEIVTEGANLVTASNDPTAHAEVVAIRAASQARGVFELRGCELYTSCEPCPMCLAAAYWARVDRIWFACTQDDASAAGFDDAFLYRELSVPLEERSIPTRSLLRDDGLAAFDAWHASPDKILY
jgi:tRNA(Arg) A34 adenosine deaminase TadA